MKEKNADVWDVFLDLHDNHKLSTAYWKGAPEFQAQLTDYLKSIIDVGVSDGKTSFPYDFSYYIFHLPKDMLPNLKLHAENVLETDPNNGAAVQFLAVETFQLTERQKPLEKYPLLEKAMVLAPKDVEICHYAFSMCTWGGHEWNKTALIALERLLERLSDSSDEELYWWLSEIHSHYDVLTKPTDFYKESLRNSVLVERWEAAIRKIATVFETTLSRKPSAREALINLADIYQTLGNIEDAQAVFENRLMQDENDRNALDGLANLHEKLGNTELAREYKLKAHPSLKWVGQVLSDFSSAVDLDGKPISLADYRGKVVLLDFWAVWCGPCVGEIPNVKEVYEKYHDKGFDVIGVSFDEDEAVLRKFITEKELPWRQILDAGGFNGAFAKQYDVRGIPAPFLIDRKGKVISVKARGHLLGELVAAEIEGKKD